MGGRPQLRSYVPASDATKNVAKSINFEMKQKENEFERNAKKLQILNAFCRIYAAWKELPLI